MILSLLTQLAGSNIAGKRKHTQNRLQVGWMALQTL